MSRPDNPPLAAHARAPSLSRWRAAVQVLPLGFEVTVVSALLARHCGPAFAAVTVGTLAMYATFTFVVVRMRTTIRKAQNAADAQANQVGRAHTSTALRSPLSALRSRLTYAAPLIPHRSRLTPPPLLACDLSASPIRCSTMRRSSTLTRPTSRSAATTTRSPRTRRVAAPNRIEHRGHVN
eukprot:6321040-Prymnesium_polylepis.1